MVSQKNLLYYLECVAIHKSDTQKGDNTMRSKLTKIAYILLILFVGGIGVQTIISCSDNNVGGGGGGYYPGGAVAGCTSSPTNPFVGTWTAYNGALTVTCTETNWTRTLIRQSGTTETEFGTYTRNGNTGTFTGGSIAEVGTATIDGNTMEFYKENELYILERVVCNNTSGTPSSASTGGSSTIVNCQVSGVCVSNVELGQCITYGGTAVPSCGSNGGGSGNSDTNTNSSGSVGGGSNIFVSCQVSGYCFDDVELSECIEYGGTVALSCGSNGGGDPTPITPSSASVMASSSSVSISATRCRDGLMRDYFCQWNTGCFAIDPALSETSGNCTQLVDECNKYGQVFINSTVEGAGTTCNGTGYEKPPSTRCTDYYGRDYFCNWPTGCYAIDPAYDPDGRSCNTMVSECSEAGRLYINSTREGDGVSCNGTLTSY